MHYFSLHFTLEGKVNHLEELCTGPLTFPLQFAWCVTPALKSLRQRRVCVLASGSSSWGPLKCAGSKLCGRGLAHACWFEFGLLAFLDEITAGVLPSQEVEDGVQAAVGAGQRSGHLVGHVGGLQ